MCVWAEPTLDEWWTDNVGDLSTRGVVANDDYVIPGENADVRVRWLETNASYHNYFGFYDPVLAGDPNREQLFDYTGDAQGTESNGVTIVHSAAGSWDEAKFGPYHSHGGSNFGWYILSDTHIPDYTTPSDQWEGAYDSDKDFYWYSEPRLNSDGQKDHLTVYEILPPEGEWSPLNDKLAGYDYVLFWEDLNNLGDNDFNDTIIAAMDGSVSWAPEPMSLVLLSIACIGGVAAGRRRRRGT